MEDVVGTMNSEVGIPKRSLTAAYKSVLSGVDHYIEEYRAMTDKGYPLDERSWPLTTAKIEYVPHGVLGHIGVWNFPFWQTMITTLPGLLTGNAIVYKPSELSTMTGLRIADMVHEAGFPRDSLCPHRRWSEGRASLGQERCRCDRLYGQCWDR